MRHGQTDTYRAVGWVADAFVEPAGVWRRCRWRRDAGVALGAFVADGELAEPTPAGGRTAARARRAGRGTYQAAYLVISDASSMISTSSRESLAKARHMAISSQESQGPCSLPVVSSTTV